MELLGRSGSFKKRAVRHPPVKTYFLRALVSWSAIDSIWTSYGLVMEVLTFLQRRAPRSTKPSDPASVPHQGVSRERDARTMKDKYESHMPSREYVPQNYQQRWRNPAYELAR